MCPKPMKEDIIIFIYEEPDLEKLGTYPSSTAKPILKINSDSKGQPS